MQANSKQGNRRQGLLKRISTPLAMLVVAGAIEGGIRVEQSLNVGCYYRELSAGHQHMSRIERALFSVLLASGDRLQEHRRQAHESPPSVAGSNSL